MRKIDYLDKFRVRNGFWATDPGTLWGLFFIPYSPGKTPLKVMAAPFDGKEQWEHVSVSLPTRCPTWEEMSYVKGLFWDEEQTVIQFHPPKSEYVNNHPFCLHLWRNTVVEIKTPPTMLIGLRGEV